MTSRKSAPDPEIRTPLVILPPSNGEFCPHPPSARRLLAERLWRRAVEDHHRRAGMTRREFAASACGSAAALWALNQVACSSDESPAFGVDESMMDDEPRAREVLSGDEFIFDVQTHLTPPPASLEESNPPEQALDFIRQIFVQSDTSVACISGFPNVRDFAASGVQANTRLKAVIERLGGPRCLIHANMDPERGPSELEYMASIAADYPLVSAWKVYPHAGNLLLDSEEIGAPFVEQARALGVSLIAAHRGLSGNGSYVSGGSPRDVVRAAQSAPDLTFLVYHSGWEDEADEAQPYDPDEADPRGLNRFIKSLQESGIGPDGNVYGELGSTWFNVLGSSEEAQHVIGKLLLHLGPERILWGTDCVLNGNPQEQIEAFRAFQISEQMQADHGYPAITDEIKRKIFGLNAASVYGVDPTATRYVIANDDVSRLRLSYLDDPRSVPMPDPREYEGPRTRREFLALLAREARNPEG
jgi:predicted TIM-barrel fold metal-dependent hydrolase